MNPAMVPDLMSHGGAIRSGTTLFAQEVMFERNYLCIIIGVAPITQLRNKNSNTEGRSSNSPYLH